MLEEIVGTAAQPPLAQGAGAHPPPRVLWLKTLS